MGEADVRIVELDETSASIRLRLVGASAPAGTVAALEAKIRDLGCGTGVGAGRNRSAIAFRTGPTRAPPLGSRSGFSLMDTGMSLSTSLSEPLAVLRRLRQPIRRPAAR